MGTFLVRDRQGLRQVSMARLMTIGRSHSNDLVLYTPYASRRHAWAWRQGDRVILEDLSSSHGTFVNGRRVQSPVYLNHSDVVTIGEAILTFSTERDPSSELTPPRGVFQPESNPIVCARCGVPNPSQARQCANCGHDLGAGASLDSGQTDPGGPALSSFPITPVGPVTARPFPAEAATQPGSNRTAGCLILFLALLAVLLITVLGVLLIYTLGLGPWPIR